MYYGPHSTLVSVIEQVHGVYDYLMRLEQIEGSQMSFMLV